MSTTDQIEFFKYQNQLKQILRNNWDENGRKESSAEHSWSVTVMCWMLKQAIEVELSIHIDESKLFKMALTHDIVEIEAGDVGAWKKEEREQIADAEHKAIEHMHSEYFEGKNLPEIKSLWYEHEKLETYEAKLVKACDQLCPLVYRVVFKCSYKGTGVNRQKLDDIFLKIVSFSQTTLNLYTELADEIGKMEMFDE